LKSSVKVHSDKILSLENEIKSLNKELRAFGKSIAQEELKINGRLKLQGNKRRAEEKTMRSKPNPQFVTPNSNMMHHGQPSPFGSPFGNNMSPLNTLVGGCLVVV